MSSLNDTRVHENAIVGFVTCSFPVMDRPSCRMLSYELLHVIQPLCDKA